MPLCRWLDTFIVTRVEFLEWTPDRPLRHPRFAGIRSDEDAPEIVRESGPSMSGGCERTAKTV